MSTVKTKLGASFIALALALAGVGTLATAGPALAGSKKEAKYKKYDKKKKKKGKKSSRKGQNNHQKAHNETNQNSKQDIDNETEQSNDVDQGATQTQGQNAQLLNGNNVNANACPQVVVGGPAVALGGAAFGGNADPDNNACVANQTGGNTTGQTQQDGDVAVVSNQDGNDTNNPVNTQSDGNDQAGNVAVNDDKDVDVDVD